MPASMAGLRDKRGGSEDLEEWRRCAALRARGPAIAQAVFEGRKG